MMVTKMNNKGGDKEDIGEEESFVDSNLVNEYRGLHL